METKASRILNKVCFSSPEGYVNYNAGTFSYIYQYKDHLGNVRLSYGDNNNDGAVTTAEIVEESSYYPFGMKQKVFGEQIYNSSYKYKFNGKELQDELGLNTYDYHARNYDPALGRWMNIDPLAEMSRRWSPYTYCYNNPLRYTDPDGMMPQEELWEMWKRSEEGENTKWTFHEDGAATGSNGEVVSIDPSKKGEGTDTGNAQYVGKDGLPNGVDLPAVRLEEVGIKGYKAPTYVPSGEYGPYNPRWMNPDAIGLSGNIHLNTGIVGELNLTVGFAFDKYHRLAFFGSYGGNFGYTGTLGSPNFGSGLTFDSHYNYGGNEDVLEGLGGRNKSYFAGFGSISGSISESARKTSNGGYIRENTGVRTVSFGRGGGYSLGTGISRGGVWMPFE